MTRGACRRKAHVEPFNPNGAVAAREACQGAAMIDDVLTSEAEERLPTQEAPRPQIRAPKPGDILLVENQSGAAAAPIISIGRPIKPFLRERGLFAWRGVRP